MKILEQQLAGYDYDKLDPEERRDQDLLNQLERTIDLQLLQIKHDDSEYRHALFGAEIYHHEEEFDKIFFREEWEQAQIHAIETEPIYQLRITANDH